MVTLVFSDDSPLTKPEIHIWPIQRVMAALDHMPITRIQEVPSITPGTHILVVHYDSILVGAKITMETW
jgi:hypothetical protein